MANTFSKIYLQFVFAVQNRKSFIPKKHKEELHKYITALVQNRNTKMIAIHRVATYVLNQEEHHRRKTFREEYLELLSKFEIPYDEKYLFRFFD
ncbi:MAG: hypothetical protein EA359_00985 [Balneolaceae bacterium]|nr:MAG: hypothetical protein EA359_00985 [Balneolaceae bacterium]